MNDIKESVKKLLTYYQNPIAGERLITEITLLIHKESNRRFTTLMQELIEPIKFDDIPYRNGERVAFKEGYNKLYQQVKNIVIKFQKIK